MFELVKWSVKMNYRVLKLRCSQTFFSVVLTLTIILLFLVLLYYLLHRLSFFTGIEIVLETDIVDFSHANNVTGFNHFIVPNIVHFIQFGSDKLSFVQVVSIRAVYANHKPDKIIIHCDCHNLTGKYWNMVKNVSVLEVIFMKRPTHIFGKPFSSVYHSSDISRIKILMEYGGIFLDSDSYVIKNLDYYRKFEMSIGWHPDQNIGIQVLIAHKNARFLKLWYNSYRYYRGERWYYNAGELPTKMILDRSPNLVHRVLYDFGVHNLVNLLYGVRSNQWRNYKCIHLLIRHKSYLVPDDSVVDFDEDNIKQYNKTFGDMARLAIYGTVDFIS